MKTRNFSPLPFLAAFLLIVGGLRLQALPQSGSWDVAVLDQILASAKPGQNVVPVGDMEISTTRLKAWRDQLAGGLSPQSAFDGIAATWPNGDVYYNFSDSGTNAVPADLQKAFLDAAEEWSTFANVHFIPVTTQTNYVTIQVETGLEGGESAVGMIGGQQFLSVSPNAWNRGTLCHEIGHTLGLVHEHQRSDRDSYVTILTNNIVPGGLGNFVLLPNSRNQGPYDFLSVMHYARNYLSTNPATLDTIEPLPASTQFINQMGVAGPVVLSDGDRAGMAAVYGSAPAISSVVTNTQDSGPGTLRAALYYAYDHPGTHITFNIPTNDPGFANGVFTIQPSDQLPWLVNSTYLDGSSQPGNSNPNGPSILLTGTTPPVPGTYANGLQFGGTNWATGTNCTASTLVINGFAASSILIYGSNTTGNIVSGCYLSVDPSGTIAASNGLPAVTISSGANGNTIGGSTVAARNIISGSAIQGLVIRDAGTHGNFVEGNYIGLNASGTAALSNTWSGIEIFGGAQSNIVGGTSPSERNVISGNGLQGVLISDTNTTGNVIEGNFIGLDPSGDAAIGNDSSGVDIANGAQDNLIGGSVPGSGNVISGNAFQGVEFQAAGTTGNLVEGNYIGLNAAGTAAIGNFTAGVGIYGPAQSNIIGGTKPGMRNVISGNGNQGVAIGYAGATGNVVEGNYVGLNASGTAAVSNTWAGVNIYGGAQANTIGGTLPGGGNVISGNGIQGVLLQDTGTASNFVQGNWIGLDASGDMAVSNTASGVEIYNGPQFNFIGGIGGRNFISGNGNNGVLMDFGPSGNVVQGNTIGLNVANSAAVPNLYAGVTMYSEAVSNVVGGINPGAANLIAGNLGGGIQLYYIDTSNNVLRANSIFSNGVAGIGINYPANQSATENPPVLASAVVTTNTTIVGSLASSPSATIHLDFYASPPPVNQAQATTYLGAVDVTTDAGGNASFTNNLASPVPIGQIITATATDPAGNTSSLSGGVPVTGTDSVGDGITDAWRAAHFGGNGATTNSSTCATCDPDHDGFDNLDEFLAGTDPNNPASKLLVGNVSANGADLLVSFSSVQGIVYRVEFANSLITSGWSLLADQLIGTGGTIQLTDPGAAILKNRYYRLEVLP